MEGGRGVSERKEEKYCWPYLALHVDLAVVMRDQCLLVLPVLQDSLPYTVSLSTSCPTGLLLYLPPVLQDCCCLWRRCRQLCCSARLRCCSTWRVGGSAGPGSTSSPPKTSSSLSAMVGVAVGGVVGVAVGGVGVGQWVG